MGYAEMIQLDSTEEHLVRRYIEQLLKAAWRAKDLVGQILTFSRQVEPEIKPVKVNLIIEEAVKLLRASIPATIETNQEFEEGPDAVMADPTQIHQILMNLCANALHAMGENGGTLGIGLKTESLNEVDHFPHTEIKSGKYLKFSEHLNRDPFLTR